MPQHTRGIPVESALDCGAKKAAVRSGLKAFVEVAPAAEINICRLGDAMDRAEGCRAARA